MVVHQELFLLCCERLFGEVQAAGRRVAYHTFSHVLDLDISFHLERRTGALSRVLERGAPAVPFQRQSPTGHPFWLVLAALSPAHCSMESLRCADVCLACVRRTYIRHALQMDSLRRRNEFVARINFHLILGPAAKPSP